MLGMTMGISVLHRSKVDLHKCGPHERLPEDYGFMVDQYVTYTLPPDIDTVDYVQHIFTPVANASSMLNSRKHYGVVGMDKAESKYVAAFAIGLSKGMRVFTGHNSDTGKFSALGAHTFGQQCNIEIDSSANEVRVNGVPQTITTTINPSYVRANAITLSSAASNSMTDKTISHYGEVRGTLTNGESFIFTTKYMRVNHQTFIRVDYNGTVTDLPCTEYIIP